MLKKNFMIVMFLVALMSLSSVNASEISDKAKLIRSSAFKYLAANQNEDGSYGKDGDVLNKTAIVVYAFASSQRKYRYNNGPFMSKAVDYLAMKLLECGASSKSESPENKQISFTTLENAKKVIDLLKPFGVEVMKDGATIKLEAKDLKLPASSSDTIKFYGMVFASSLPAVLSEAENVKTKADALAVLKKLAALQNQTSPEAKEFGEVKSLGEGIFADPIVSTALVGYAADRIKAASKALK